MRDVGLEEKFEECNNSDRYDRYGNMSSRGSRNGSINNSTHGEAEIIIDCCIVTSTAMNNPAAHLLPGDVLLTMNNDLLFNHHVSTPAFD